jgi:pantoate--beta-alanine ligase
MHIFRTTDQMRGYLTKQQSKSTGFVPTMGALHKGHAALIQRSKEENDLTIASIYLNPTQFNDKKDLETYPVTWDSDIKQLENLEVDVLFAPDYEQMYPDDYHYRIMEDELSKILCGATRPGHFDGVLTIVMKFFMIIGACNAYFGEKDYQQFQLIKGMVNAFFLPITVIPCPTVRETDGLAMSSRNKKLSPEGRKKAPILYQQLSSGKELKEISEILENEGFRVDYLKEQEGRRYAAVFLDGVRLIDNV